LFEQSVAWKHIITRRRQTLLSMLAIGLAVAIIIVFRSLMNGSFDSFFNIFFELAPHVLVTPKEGEDYIYLYQTLMGNIWAIPGVLAVSPSLSTTATLSHEGNVENVGFSGVIPEELDKVTKIGKKYMLAGDLSSVQNGHRLVLGKTVADNLEIKLGDSIEASFPDAKALNLVISGIFKTGVEEWDNSAFVSLDTAREFLGQGDVITYIDIHLQDPQQADAVAERIAVFGYKADSWRTLFPEFEKTIKFETIQNNLILIIVLIVASFGIANVMNMLVLEKTKDIGMLMAMGASRSQIMRTFLLESGLLGLLGGISGCALGYLISAYFHSLQITVTPATAPQPIVLKFLVNPWDLLAFPILALLLSMIAGLYPALQASRLDPVVALKG
jgi:lipoprotein-releasing system permease protein